jgi:hypothetical protein
MLFSDNDEKRDIEVAFLRRLLAATAQEGRSFNEQLGLIQSPIFEELAAALCDQLPVDATFGRFRDDE